MHWLTPVVVAYGMWGTFIVVWNVTQRHTAKTMTTPTKSREQVYSLVLVAAIICAKFLPGKEAPEDAAEALQIRC